VKLDLDRYRQRAESFIEELSREHYRHFAGLQDSFDIEAIYSKYSDLSSKQTVIELKQRYQDSPTGDEGRRNLALLEFAVDAYLGQATKAQAAKLAELEASLTVTVAGEDIGYRESAPRQANELDSKLREEIELARNSVVASDLNPLLKESLESAHVLAKELGWSSYYAMYQELRGIDLAALASETEQLLVATESSYKQLLEQHLESLDGPSIEEFGRHDFPWLFRAEKFDKFFPQERLVESFTKTLNGLGIDLAEQSNIVLDVEAREKKSPRAFCAPVKVPGEIYLVVAPIGGRDDYQTLLHEGGHSEHFAHVDTDLPFEFKQLGDNSVTESFAFLFHYLTEDPVWLKEILGVSASEDLIRHGKLQRLYFMRRYSAKLCYEVKLHSAEQLDTSFSQLYADQLTRATAVSWQPEGWLNDVDPGFYAASYLRAWALESSIKSHLKQQFGERWFTDAAAGDFLISLWREGQRLNADALCQEKLGKKLDFSALTDQVVQ